MSLIIQPALSVPEAYSPDRRPAYRWELLALCWCCFFLVQADRQAFNVVLPLIRSDLHASAVQLGAISSFFSVVFALLLPLSGYAGDVANRKRVVLISLIVWSLGTTLAGTVTGFFPLLMCLSVATAGGESFYFPSANSLIGQFHQRSRSLAMSIHQTSLYVGLILSGLVAGWIGDHLGWRVTFLAFGGCGLILAPLFAWRVQNTQQPEKPPSSIFEDLPALWKEVIKKRCVLLLGLAFCGMVFVNVGYLTWMPTYLHDRFGLSLADSGFRAMFYHHALAFIGVLSGGWLSDRMALRRYGARFELAAAAMLLATPFLVALRAPTQGVIYLGLAGFGLFRGLYEANMWAALFDVVPKRFRGQATALMISVAYVIGSTSPLLLGFAMTLGSLGNAFALLAIVYLLAGTCLVTARVRYLPTEYLTET